MVSIKSSLGKLVLNSTAQGPLICVVGTDCSRTSSPSWGNYALWRSVPLALYRCPHRPVTCLSLPFSSVWKPFAQPETRHVPFSLSSPALHSCQGYSWPRQCQKSPWPQLQWCLRKNDTCGWGMAEGNTLPGTTNFSSCATLWVFFISLCPCLASR